MTEYYSIAHAALGIHVTPITIRRWIKRNWLQWPKPYRLHPQQHDALIVLKSDIQATRKQRLSMRAMACRKHFTPEQAAVAKYEAVKRYRAANPERVRREGNQSSALKRHPFFAEMRAEMLAYYGKRCLACRKRPSACMDHVRPLSQCGENHPRNLQPLCVSCNTAKRNTCIDYRPDTGKWMNLRWGGWVVNGRASRIPWRVGKRKNSEIALQREQDIEWMKEHAPQQWDEMEGRWDRGGELGSIERATFIARHRLSIDHWRLAHARHGAMYNPDEYKSFISNQAPTAHLSHDNVSAM